VPTATAALLIDDDARLGALVTEYLGRHEIDVTVAADGERGLSVLRKGRFDVVLLDVMLPGADGFEVCRRLRAAPELATVPVIMLTARGDDVDKIVGLELGADDYLAKPFEPRELLLRIANILKRQLPAGPPIESVRFGDFVFHIGRGELRRGEEIVHLTDREREMLGALTAKPGETVSRLALAGNGPGVNERAVDVQVNRLRRKIERDPANPLIVQTVRGIGYRLMVAP